MRINLGNYEPRWLRVGRNAMDDISDIKRLYDSDPFREETRLDRHPIEFDITWRYLTRHLPPTGHILEIGAATGRYTLELARKGYELCAVDLSEACLARACERARHEGLSDRVTCHVADARDLSGVPGTAFDAVLFMGPLYHLIEQDDRIEALRQASARLKPGGIFFSAMLSRFGLVNHLLHDMPDWIEDHEAVRFMFEFGHEPHEYPRQGFRGYYAKVDEMASLHEAVGLKTLVLAGVEPAMSYGEAYNSLTGPARDRWLDLLFDLSSEPSLIASSIHLLYIGRKLH